MDMYYNDDTTDNPLWEKRKRKSESISSLVGELVEQHPHHLDLHLQVLDVGRGVLEQLAEPARLAAGRHQPPKLPHLLHHPGVLQDIPLADRRRRRRPCRRLLAPTISSHPRSPVSSFTCLATDRRRMRSRRD